MLANRQMNKQLIKIYCMNHIDHNLINDTKNQSKVFKLVIGYLKDLCLEITELQVENQ